MKRFVLAACMLGMLVASTAIADPVWTTSRIYWRTTGATPSDSATFRNGSSVGGVGIAAYVWHVSAPINMINATLPNLPGTQTGSDSVGFARFSIFPTNATGATPAADSVYLQVEVSMDGFQWVKWGTPQTRFVTSDSSTTFGPSVSLCEQSSTTNSVWMWLRAKTDNGATSNPLNTVSGTAPTTTGLFGWTYLRFTFSSRMIGEFAANLSYWVDDPRPAKFGFDRAPWRRNTNTVAGFIQQGYLDSMLICKNGTASDTTAAFSLFGFNMPPLRFMNNGANVADTTAFIQLRMMPDYSNGTLPSINSTATVITQVSDNGADWLTCAPVAGVAATKWTGTGQLLWNYGVQSGNLQAYIGIAGAGSPVASISGANVHRHRVFGFSYIRWIIAMGNAADTGCYQLQVAGWKPR